MAFVDVLWAYLKSHTSTTIGNYKTSLFGVTIWLVKSFLSKDIDVHVGLVKLNKISSTWYNYQFFHNVRRRHTLKKRDGLSQCDAPHTSMQDPDDSKMGTGNTTLTGLGRLCQGQYAGLSLSPAELSTIGMPFSNKTQNGIYYFPPDPSTHAISLFLSS